MCYNKHNLNVVSFCSILMYHTQPSFSWPWVTETTESETQIRGDHCTKFGATWGLRYPLGIFVLPTDWGRGNNIIISCFLLIICDLHYISFKGSLPRQMSEQIVHCVSCILKILFWRMCKIVLVLTESNVDAPFALKSVFCFPLLSFKFTLLQQGKPVIMISASIMCNALLFHSRIWDLLWRQTYFRGELSQRLMLKVSFT